MNYYIQGNKEKADQIKAAFEKLGYNTGYLGFTSGQLYYTVEGKVELMRTKSLQNLIKTHPDYKELELPIEFKDGDIIGFNDYTHNDGSYIDWVGIYRHQSNDFINHQHFFHCVVTSINTFRIGGSCRVFTAYPATKEQRDLLFRKMREAGYQWDADKKELRKIKPHYDIANFYAGMPVLVRDNDKEWRYVPFSHITNSSWKFNAVGTIWEQCIPFNDDTKHLLGTTNMCGEEYINW